MLSALILGCLLVQAPDLEKGIKAKEVEVRLATVQLLVRDADPRTEKLLVNAARDEDWEVALRATEGLGERRAKSAVDALLKLTLDAPIRRIRVAAARALFAIAPDEAATVLARRLATNDAVPALEALTIVLIGRETKADLGAVARVAEKGKDDAARAAAAAVVGAANWKERERALTKILSGTSIRGTCAALDSMANSPRDADLTLLLDLLAKPKLDDCVERRAIAATRALLAAGPAKTDESKVSECLAPLLSSKSPQVVARAVRLVESVSTVSSTNATGTAPRTALGPDRALAALKPALENADPLPRALAAHALARLGVGALEVARAMATGDKAPRVRRAAFEALCTLGPVSEEANRAVAIRLLATDPDAEVRRTAAVRLGTRGLGEAVEPLTAALLDKDWGVAVCAAVSLGLTQAGPSVEPLSKLSKSSPDWKLRAAAIVGLSRLYLKSAIPPTIDALADADPFVVRCAHAQLVAVAHETFEPKREPWLEWWTKNGANFLLVDPEKAAELRKRFSRSETSAPEIFRDLDVVVLESRGDHIESVLDGQKIVHRRTQAGKIAAGGLTADGLFVANCTGEIEKPDVERIRWFVLVGGHLFGSCWALHETIERALPGPIAKFETASEVVRNVEARVCIEGSPYIEGVFTPGVQPIYALEGAHVIAVLEPERVEVLIDSPECAEEFGSGNLAAWFEAGHGTVLDSANHFEAQGLKSASELQKPLERQAYAVDHMGLPLEKLRAVKGAEWWSSTEKASREVTDLSVFRLVTNFVRLRRLERSSFRRVRTRGFGRRGVAGRLSAPGIRGPAVGPPPPPAATNPNAANMIKVSLHVLLLAFVSQSALAFAAQEPGHEGHNHPPGQGHEQQPTAPVAPIPTGPVRLTDVAAGRVLLAAGLIGKCFEVNRSLTLPALLAHCESNGFVQNFALASGREKGEHRGGLDSDAQVYAWVEGAAHSLAQAGDKELEAKLDGIVDAIAAAQKDDGYLNTYFQIGGKGAPWSDLANGRELETGGRLIEAAIACQSSAKKTRLLDVARKFADHVDRAFGPGKKTDPSGHPGIEAALAKLFEATGEARYLTLARFFVEARGNVAGRTGYGAVAQDQKPLKAETVFVGDPLRGTAFYAGAADVARLMSDAALAAPLASIWTDAATKKTNIVGALGNAGSSDGVGAPFDVGSTTTFDTRSAIGLVEWSQSMLLATGDAKYADMVDRSLHNAVLAGTSANGGAHACTNRLASNGDFARTGLPECGACAADIARFVASTPGLVFATAGNTIYICQYVPCQAEFMINDVKVRLEMQTKWPYAGLVDIKVQSDKQVTFSIKFRRPAWCKTVFYQHDLKEREHSTDYPGTEAGWEVYERRYDPMDGCKINFLGPVRREVPPPEVAGDKGRVAVVRGSLVYALEGVDNRGSAHSMVLPETASLSATDRPDTVFTSIRAFRSREGRVVETGADGTPAARGAEIVFIPYYQLGNRTKSDFVVWVPQTPELATVAGSPPR